MTIQGLWDEAAEAAESAYRELMISGESGDIALCLESLAICRTNQGRLADAQRLFDRARDAANDAGFVDYVGILDYNSAYVRYLLGDYEVALSLFRRARRQFSRPEDQFYAAHCDLDQAELLLELGLVQESAYLAGRAQLLFEALELPYERGKCCALLGLCARSKSRTGQALGLFASAREYFQDCHNQAWCRLVDIYTAEVLLETGRLHESLDLALGAVGESDEPRILATRIRAQILCTRVELAMGKAEQAAERARSILKEVGFLDRALLESDAYQIFGQALEDTGNPSEAANAYLRAARPLERLSSHLPAMTLRNGHLHNRRLVYEALFDLSQRAGDIESAFKHMEKAKSPGLAHLIAGSAVGRPRPASEDPAQLGRVRELKGDLKNIEKKITEFEFSDSTGASEQIHRLRTRARDAEWELQDLLRGSEIRSFLESHNPGSAAVDIDNIRSALPPDSTLLEYFFARGQVFCLVLSRSAIASVHIGDVQRLAKIHRLFRFSLLRAHESSDRGRPAPSTLAHLSSLYDLLVRPIRHRLDTPRLLIVPHGFLYQAPFHALFEGQGFLADEHSIFYAPSASIFRLATERAPAGNSRSLVLAVSDERAPWIRPEAERVTQLLGNADLFLGERATSAVLQKYGGDARFIHIATHGYFHRENPLFSSIRLADGHFNVHDLHRQRWGAELVVLSGCSTGLSSTQDGSEVTGLVRGALATGARSVMVSLWNVDDEATAAFMGAFYARLKEGDTKDCAMARAMALVRETKADPFFWAPFILLGDPRAVDLREPLNPRGSCQ